MSDTQFTIEKVPVHLMNKRTGSKRTDYPLEKLQPGEMFKINADKKHSVYNAIRHRVKYTRQLEGWVFSIRSISEDTMAVIRIK